MVDKSLNFFQGVLIASLFLVNEGTVQWALAIRIGNYSFVEGFTDALKYFSIVGFLFLTVLRAVPLLLLHSIVKRLLRKKFKQTWGAAIGGFIGIWWCYIWMTWDSLLPLYTENRVSSTTTLIFLFIPIYSSITGAIGASVGFSIFGLKTAIIEANQIR